MKSIRTYFTLLTVLVSLAAIGIITAISVFSIHNLGDKDANQMLLLMCENGEKNLDFYFDSVEQSVRTLSDIVEEDLKDRSEDQLQAHVNHMRSVFEKTAFRTNGVLTYYYRIDPEFSDSVKGFWYTNLDGDGFTEQKVTDITKFDPNDPSHIPWFTVPKATGEAVWLPPYLTDTLNIRVLSYNVPVYWHDTFVGVMGVEIDYDLLASVVNNIVLYEHGYAFVTNEDGKLLYHPLMDVTTMKDEDSLAIPDGLHSEKKIIHYQYHNEDKIAAWLPLRNNTRLYVSVPVSEIDGRWLYMVWLILFASTLILITVSILVLWYTNRLTNPLRELTEATEQVNKGDYNIELNYKGEDEVGVLTRTFSNLVNNLKAQIHAVAESEQANEAKSTFLSNMSHEIRTPITTILGMNEIVSRDSKDENILRCSDNIRKAGTSLLGIISDILDFSKIEAGKMDLIIEPYSLPDLIADLYNMVRFRAQEKELDLHFEIDPHLPCMLIGDELRIKQVITNLLTNAIKYTETGKVTLTISLDKSENNTATVYVAVDDTGIGIRPDEMDRLFETFNRLDTRRTHTIEGVGLGLSICSRLLKMMNTSLFVESVYNKGSTFYFYLDQEISDSSPIEHFDALTLSHKTGTRAERFGFISPESRILLVDDTQMNLEVIKGLLKPTQIQIDAVDNGPACVDKFSEESYDIVFLDYRMPHMDGIETLTALKERNPGKAEQTPIISLTANAVSGERERMLEAGFTDYLTKPVNVADMEKMLLTYLPEESVELIEDETSEADPAEGLPEEVFAYEWLDPKEGVAFCGSAELYLRALDLFAKTIDEKAALLEKCLKEGDIEQYTITVHAIKSTTLSIGMAAMSERARELELAGKSGDTAKLTEKTPEFLQDFRGYQKDLEQILARA